MYVFPVAKNYVCGLWCEYVNVQLHTNDCGQSLTPVNPCLTGLLMQGWVGVWVSKRASKEVTVSR